MKVLLLKYQLKKMVLKLSYQKKIEKQRSEQQFVVPQQIPMNYSNPVQSAPITSNTNTSENNTANSDNSNLHEINSPMVGTFYKSPSPDAEAFVKVGDRVEPGTTLCIIEAMKVMNEIECDVSGTIEKILIENASPVEFNQVLFLIKAD